MLQLLVYTVITRPWPTPITRATLPMSFLLGLTPNKQVNKLGSNRSPRRWNFWLRHFIEQCHDLFLLVVILPELVQGQHVSADFNHLSCPHIIKLSTTTLMIHMRDINIIQTHTGIARIFATWCT